MQFSSTLTRLAATATVAASITAASEATFVQWFVVKTQVTVGGVLLDQYQVKARFNGPTDTDLNAFNLVYLGGATVADPYGAFYHKDNSDYNGGVLSRSYGSWAPTQTGSATQNRPYDSFLTIGGAATATNTTAADPSWNSGGSGSHAGGAAGWNRADLLNNGTMGWFNSSPPNLQGRVGVAPNTATDVLVCQFVVDRDANIGSWSLTIGYNDGVPGSAVQFGTGTFLLCPGAGTFYRDLDGDGFGSSASGFTTGCSAPSGYVSDNTDCDDSNAAINPNTVWHRDLDGDGFGSSVSGAIAQCAQPAGYVLSNVDCDDSNAAVNPNTVWTRDLDGDGFGSSGDGTLVQCARPAGYVLNNTDNCPSLANPGQEDCNSNGTGDRCEIAAGTLSDCDSDGIADICEGGTQISRASPALAPLGAGTTLNYSFTGLPRSYGSGVRLTLDATGDLDSTNEFLGFTFDGGQFEYYFVNGASLCPAVPNRAVKTFTNAQFNALVADGTLSISIVPSGTVSAAECPTSNIRISLDYTALGSGTDCNSNGVLDTCEIGNGLLADCNLNALPDSCELASGAATDCNGNGALDACDLASGTSTDLNGNGTLDECSGEFVVGGSGYATIASAIDAAPSGTEIQVGPGTYSGGVVISTKSIRLKSIAGAESTILSGSGLDQSILTFRTSGASGSSVDGFTLRDGAVGTLDFGYRLGGAVYCLQTSVDFRNCRFIANNSAYGGALYGLSYSGQLVNCLFQSNHATDDGGAVQVGFGGTVSFSGCAFSGNSAGINGGGLHVVQWQTPPTTSVTVHDTDFLGNSAGQYGGAVSWYAGSGGDLAFTGCIVESNASPSAAFTRDPGSPLGTLRFALQGSRFCLNSGGNVSGPIDDQGGNTFSQDCNENGVCDADEIASGAQQDCDGNGIPDSCELARVFAWGENTSGQTSVPSSLRTTRDISAGCNHALAVNQDRQVVAWGSNSFGQSSVPSSVTTALAVAAGCDHSLALRTDGTVAAWGYNAYGQTNVPTAANGGVAQIAAGANHSGVRKSNGSLVLWGRNIDGECNVPGGLGAATKLALGGAHSMALRGDGTVVCWGLNNFGQCTVPAIGGALVDVAAGCYHSVGLRSDGTVRVWGSGLFGQTSIPAGLSGVIKVAAGPGQHTVALKSDGRVVAWGWNAFGQATVPAAISGVSQISAGGTFSFVSAPGNVDCNGNGVIDSCDIASGAAADCNGNGKPDTCDIVEGTATDCDNDTVLDSCELASGNGSDCNGNGRLDNCDLALGSSTDLNGNLVPDECSGEWIVGGSGFSSIQAAINAAPSGTVIRVAAGTYTGAISITTKSVTLRSLAGATQTILSGSGLDSSIIAIRSAAANGTVIDGFTLRDGPVGTSDFGYRLGGAIYCLQTTATITNCRFLNNTAGYGGAIYALNLTGTISNCLFDGNHAIDDAGAIQVGYGGDTVLTANTYTNNTAGRNGGAVQVVQHDTPPLSSTVISDSTFRSNSAVGYAGAISWYVALGGDLPISNCTVESNSSTTAVVSKLPGASSPTANFVVSNSRFCLNTTDNISGPFVNGGGNTLSQDCNANGLCDADEIAAGTVPDCDSNGFPDSCQLGSVIAWGEDTSGQSTVPSSVGSARAISAGCNHGLAIRADRTVVAWGSSSFGQTAVPAGLGAASQISAGCDHSLGLGIDGALFAWGYNAYGQCTIPSAANGSIAQIAAGANHSGVRKTNGSLVLWGRNIDGECNVPGTLPIATKLALGGAHSVALRGDGTVVCWGLNNFGQCSVPANVGSLRDIAAGCYHTVGLRTDGTVRAWGSNLFGQTSVPSGLSGVVKIAAGPGQHTMALKADGSVFAWGWSAFGQTSVPPTAEPASMLAVGGTYSLARTKTADDCDSSGTIDACELAGGTAADCNGNGIVDACDIASGASSDCDTNGIPDACELASGAAADCNGNGTLDFCDIASGFASDCNGNGRPDTCDLADGVSTDLDGNGRPDECAGEWIVGGSGFASIQAAVNAAPNGTTLRIAAGTYGPVNLGPKSVGLEALGALGGVVIDGGGAQACLAMNSITGAQPTFRKLVLRNGAAENGGGISIVLASPTVQDCTIEDCVASVDGGGILSNGGAPLIERCTIRRCAATSGGGIAAIGGAAGSGVRVVDCVLDGNAATVQGGSVFSKTLFTMTGPNSQVLNSMSPLGAGARFDATGSASVGGTRFCLNEGENISGPYSNLGGNVLSQDCNANGICDADEIASGAEADCDQNGIPDSCQIGTLFGFGENTQGQLGFPSGTTGAKEISAGCTHALALKPDGTVAAWGGNAFGQSNVPASVVTALSVSAGCDHSLALRSDGTVAAWGYNQFGQTNVPTQANGDVAQIAAGVNHSGVRKTGGSLVMWGRNLNGECNVPGGLGAATKLALGGAHSMVIRADGTVVCWGLNNFGQCSVPANAGTLQDVTAGCYHTVGLRTDGTVRAWGSNIFGQTSVPAGLSDVVKVTSGCSGQHTLALKSDGTVVGWGWNQFGQATIPYSTKGSALAAGGTFSIVRSPVASDCNGNGVADTCDIASGFALDCNGNSIPDSCDIATGFAVDCNANGTPDSCDIASGFAGDCDSDGTLDSCEIASGAATDCNGNSVPDSCELASGSATDCNGNSVLDSCDIASGFAVDCNANSLPDTCDIASGNSSDLNSNGRPDECAGEWVVGGSGFRNVSAAIAAAPGGTTIQVAPGTYSGAAVISAGPITLRSIGGPAVTTLSGQGIAASILAVRGAAANGTEIDGFTFSGGTSGTTFSGVQVGGALLLESTSGAVRNCRFAGNSAEFGGAIYAYDFSGTVESCVFESNSASADGGAAQFGFGGACTFRGNTLVNNSAGEHGGAMHVVYDAGAALTSVSLEQCVFSGNAANTSGGALSWYAQSGGAMLVSDCTVELNDAPDAAFARLVGTLPFAVTNSRFCRNTLENFSGSVIDGGGNVFSQDCNRNGLCDADEIAAGAESDCNGNGIPDSCELAGRLFTFGDDGLGQTSAPPFSGVPIAVAAGCDHSLVLRADGTLVAWGLNSFGESTIPAGLDQVTAIAAGCDHNLALRANGTVAAWGYNAYGQCNVPQISGTVAQIAAGANHSGVRTFSGSVILWGRNASGESTVPASLGPVQTIALGGAHSAAVLPNGSVACWGLNNFGQCTVPANVGVLRSIALGCYHSVGLRTNGTVVTWGSSIFGQTSTPAGLTDVVAIASGSGQHTLALRADGTVVGWGWNAFGQASVPASAQGIVAMAAGGSHSILHAASASDCNQNAQLDSCEIASGAQSDCNGNGTIDSCDLAAGVGTDCNANGALDSCEIAAGAADCNANSLPDSCDLASGISTDLNSSGVPDECEFVVGGSGYTTIQAAINAAPNGATIQVGEGTWSPISVTGRSLTIRSINGPGTTTIAGGDSARVVDISNVAPRTFLLEGFTIRDGLSAIGAGIRITNGSPTIRNCVIVDNTATAVGGGVACTTSTALFEQCTIATNTAVNGGGVAVVGSAPSGLPNQFDLCQINDNDSSSAGAGFHSTGSLLLTGCECIGNQAGGQGGGLYTSPTATSVISSSYFCLNTPSNTAGAFVDLGGNTFGADCNSNGICDLDDIANGEEDKNDNGEIDSCEIARGDLNLDGNINGADLTVLLNFWGATNPPTGDLNGDGVIGGADLTILLNNWGT